MIRHSPWKSCKKVKERPTGGRRSCLFKFWLLKRIPPAQAGGILFWWASQDLNPGPSGYENVANFEIQFFLWNLVTIS